MDMGRGEEVGVGYMAPSLKYIPPMNMIFFPLLVLTDLTLYPILLGRSKFVQVVELCERYEQEEALSLPPHMYTVPLRPS